MLSRAVTPKQKGRRWLTALATLSLVTGTLVFSGTATGLTQTEFELDKNATDNLTTQHLGVIKSSLNSTATSAIVCERTGVTYPLVFPFTIQIDGEQMSVTSYGATSNATGGCSFSDPAVVKTGTRVYNMTRAANGTTAASHPGDSDVTHMVTGAAAGDDWDQVYANILANPDSKCDSDTGAETNLGAVECLWVHDDFGVSVFTTGGSKDDLNINPIAALSEPGTGWKHTDSSVPPSDEILDAFAIKYDDGTRQLLFFGADRYATNGAKDMGFWFFHDEVGLTGDGTFSGNHTRPSDGGTPLDPSDDTRGDILLLSTFTQGGAVTSIRVFEWVGVGGNTNGTLQSIGAFGDCVPGIASDAGCNTVNNTTVPSPWPYQGSGSTNVANTLYSGALAEGGIDLTALGLEGCFSSFMAETRSSPEPGAQLKDFALGSFEACESGLVTTPANGSGTDLVDSGGGTSLPDVTIGTGSAGVDVTDNAALSVTGINNWSGTLSFYLCGPIDSPDTCETDGVLVSSGAVDQDTVQPITSGTANLTSVGRYCWRGFFDSDTEGVDDATDATAGECFEVLPVTPTLTTTAVEASVGLSPTIIGSLADLNGDGVVDGDDDSNAFYGDTSIINGALDCDAWTVDNHGAAGDGTIDGSDDCTLIGYDGTVDGVTIEVVNGEFQTADGPLPTVFNAGDPDNSDVGDSDFAWSTIFGRVDSNGDETIDGDDCHFGIIGGADILGSAAGCGFAVTPPSALNGHVDLNGDGTITAADDSCSDGCFFGRDVFNGLVAAGTVDFGQAVYDVATLTGTAYQPGATADLTYPTINATMDTPADGTITFTLVGPDGESTDCTTVATGDPQTSNPEDVTVSGDGDYVTTGFTPDLPGDYHWKASYDGSSPNTLGTTHNDTCNEAGEDVTVQQLQPTMDTAQDFIPNDSATITVAAGAGDLDGAVTFYLWVDDATCGGGDLGTADYTEGPLAVSDTDDGLHDPLSASVSTSNTTAYGTTGTTFDWIAVFTSNNSAHLGVTSDCGNENSSITIDNGVTQPATP